MFNFHNTKKCFFICIVLLLKQTYGMLELKNKKDYFSNISKDAFFSIMNQCLFDIAQTYTYKQEDINYMHVTNGNGDKFSKFIQCIKSISLTSKKFFDLTEKYRATELKKFISESPFFIYAIDTNNIKLINSNFLSTEKNYKKQIAMFRWLQFETFYSAIVNIQAENIYNDPNNEYLVKASKNILDVSIQIMHNAIVEQFLENYTPHIHRKIMHIYRNKRNYEIFPSFTWLERYIDSQGKEKPILLNHRKSFFTNYTKHEKKKLNIFINNHKKSCMKNKNNIPNILKKNLSSTKRVYLLMRFLIVFNSVDSYRKREALISNTLTTLSNEYWYNPQSFF